MKALAIVLTASMFLATIPAVTAHAAEARAHDGFFLRLSAGGGGAGSEISDPTGSIDFNGTSGDINFAVGGMVAPNFALHGTIFGWSVNDPDATVNIVGLGTGSGTLHGTATMSGFGPGATYYFMPVNMYASASVGFGRLKLDGDVDGETKTGFAMDLTVGKEWWVGDNWGLGLSGGFIYHSLPDKDVSESWSGSAFALRFSATMN